MYNLFFKDIWAVLSTLFLLITIFYILFIFKQRHQVTKWRPKIFTLFMIGLLLCIFVVMRDDYVASMQGGIGFFDMNSIQIYMAYFVATLIGIVSLSSIFIKNPRYQKNLFFILASFITVKALLIEVSRLLM